MDGLLLMSLAVSIMVDKEAGSNGYFEAEQKLYGAPSVQKPGSCIAGVEDIALRHPVQAKCPHARRRLAMSHPIL